MRHGILLGMLLLAAAGSLLAGPTDPARAVREFYANLQRFKVSGLPQGEAWEAVKPQLSEALASRLEDARKEQEAFRREFPDEKPPFVEGNLFGSLFEGFRSFVVKEPRLVEGRAEVPVEFSYTSEGQTTKWSDTVILVPVGEAWRIDDLRYGGDWEFAPRGTLREALAPEKP